MDDSAWGVPAGLLSDRWGAIGARRNCERLFGVAIAVRETPDKLVGELVDGAGAMEPRVGVCGLEPGLSTTSADAEKAVWKKALAAMPDLRHDVHEVVVDGDVEMARVVVTGTMTASFGGFEGTGRSFRIDQAVVTHLRNGKVTEAWEIADIGSLREQVAPG